MKQQFEIILVDYQYRILFVHRIDFVLEREEKRIKKSLKFAYLKLIYTNFGFNRITKLTAQFRFKKNSNTHKYSFSSKYCFVQERALKLYLISFICWPDRKYLNLKKYYMFSLGNKFYQTDQKLHFGVMSKENDKVYFFKCIFSMSKIDGNLASLF